MTIVDTIEERRVITLKDLEQDLIERVAREVLEKDSKSVRQSRERNFKQGPNGYEIDYDSKSVIYRYTNSLG